MKAKLAELEKAQPVAEAKLTEPEARHAALLSGAEALSRMRLARRSSPTKVLSRESRS
jgi:hypothetical protein